MNLDALFSQLHGALTKELLERVESGEATASELSVARQFLNDNSVTGAPQSDNPLGKLSEKLSAFDADNPLNH
jgi:hypothetical protein